MGHFGIGNTFGSDTYDWNNGQKRVWREIRHRFPSGGTFKSTDLETFKGKVIPSGTPVAFDQTTKVLTIVTGKEESGIVIDGFTQEDVYVKDGVTVATATVIYAGEIYAPVLKAAVLGGNDAALTAVKAAAPAGIKFVQ